MADHLTTLTPQEASTRILSFLKEGRLVQHEWHRRNGGGRELACLIGSIDPDIDSAGKCPSGVMPRWLAELTVSLFDGQTKPEALAWAERYAGLMSRWHVLDASTWVRCDMRFRIAAVRYAIAAAEPVAKDKSYWPAITKAAEQVCEALEGRGDRAAAYAAADAAARTAAYAAARTAADAAARTAARAAAYAAADAAARTAAYAAAYAVLASRLLDIIELEVLAAEVA